MFKSVPISQSLLAKTNISYEMEIDWSDKIKSEGPVSEINKLEKKNCGKKMWNSHINKFLAATLAFLPSPQK